MGRKYHHMGISMISRDAFDQLQILTTLSYDANSVDESIMEDSTFYFLPLNNCRHYLLRLLRRLCAGRAPTGQENLVFRSIEQIKFQACPATCADCKRLLMNPNPIWDSSCLNGNLRNKVREVMHTPKRSRGHSGMQSRWWKQEHWARSSTCTDSMRHPMWTTLLLPSSLRNLFRNHSWGTW